MAGRETENRVFVGGLSWDVTERELEDVFSRYGKIIDSQIVLERETGRPRGFGFLTFADRRDMEDAIREMDGREFGDRVITVNKAQPRLGTEDPGHGYGGGYPFGGRGSFGGGYNRSVSDDDCFKCGRPGHWARDCPSAGSGRGVGGRGRGEFSSRPRFDGGRGFGDRIGGDRDRYIDDRYDVGRYGDRYDGGRYGDRDRYESRERYGTRDRYFPDRYPPSGDRFAGDRYVGSDRYPQNGFSRDRAYDRDGGAPRGGGGGGDRYAGGGPSRYEGKSYRDRPAPYDRPRRGGGRPSSFDDRY